MPQTFDRLLLSSKSGINLTPECEAYGCNKKATKQITIDAGRHGNIDLNVCKSCLPKFNDEIVPSKEGVRYQSLPINGKRSDSSEYIQSTSF